MDISVFKLFLIFLRIGALTFGGGYAMIPIIEKELVYRYKLLTPEDFYDSLVVVQSLPGAIAINFAVFLGLKLKGSKGAIAGLMGVVIPSFVFILVISIFFFQFVDNPIVAAFFKGVRLSVVALMFLAGYKLFKMNRNWFGIFMIVFTFALVIGFNTHPFIIVFLAGFIGYLVTQLKAVVDHDYH
ncbi:chromate transporter [Liberiplasma polymorphum]|uniref:chromate transporter n=1 Tax=Liberiplasma polymorphum TaxID=3374570 RepID=UPI003775204E